MSYQYLLAPRGDGFAIIHVQSCAHLGYIKPCGVKYRVQNDGSDEDECDDVASVNSLDEAIPALLTYYEKQPPKWDRESATVFTKLSQFGLVQVELDQSGWLAYRYHDDYYHSLLRDGKPAIFSTSEEAQGAADTHVRDGYPNAEATEDGLSWAVEYCARIALIDRGAGRAFQLAVLHGDTVKRLHGSHTVCSLPCQLL